MLGLAWLCEQKVLQYFSYTEQRRHVDVEHFVIESATIWPWEHKRNDELSSKVRANPERLKIGFDKIPECAISIYAVVISLNRGAVVVRVSKYEIQRNLK